MSLRCVVGNCGQQDDKVERCYWGRDKSYGDSLKTHAYLDLCWYHQEVFCSQVRTVEILGWDKEK